MKKNVLLFSLLCFYVVVFGQYKEDFSGQDGQGAQGACGSTALSSCASMDLSGVDWTLTGNFSGLFDTGDNGGYVTGGQLNWSDNDNLICWESPPLDISAAGGSFMVTLDITSVGFDASDIGRLDVSVDGGGFMTIDDYDGSEPTLEGTVTGTMTAVIRVCVDMNAGSETLSIDNICIPTAGVVVVPVELANFEAKALQEGIQLDWLTLTELDNDRFEIEHSSDGKTFATIGKVAGQGTTIEPHAYSFLHKDAFKSTNYYRLKQIDFDGSFEYSETLVVELKTSSTIVKDLSPNPSSGNVNLNVITKTSASWSITVYDLMGKAVYGEQRILNGGENTLDFNFSNLGNGTFFVRLENGNEQIYRKLVLVY